MVPAGMIRLPLELNAYSLRVGDRPFVQARGVWVVDVDTGGPPERILAPPPLLKDRLKDAPPSRDIFDFLREPEPRPGGLLHDARGQRALVGGSRHLWSIEAPTGRAEVEARCEVDVRVARWWGSAILVGTGEAWHRVDASGSLTRLGAGCGGFVPLGGVVDDEAWWIECDGDELRLARCRDGDVSRSAPICDVYPLLAAAYRDGTAYVAGEVRTRPHWRATSTVHRIGADDHAVVAEGLPLVRDLVATPGHLWLATRPLGAAPSVLRLDLATGSTETIATADGRGIASLQRAGDSLWWLEQEDPNVGQAGGARSALARLSLTDAWPAHA